MLQFLSFCDLLSKNWWNIHLLTHPSVVTVHKDGHADLTLLLHHFTLNMLVESLRIFLYQPASSISCPWETVWSVVPTLVYKEPTNLIPPSSIVSIVLQVMAIYVHPQIIYWYMLWELPPFQIVTFRILPPCNATSHLPSNLSPNYFKSMAHDFDPSANKTGLSHLPYLYTSSFCTPQLTLSTASSEPKEGTPAYQNFSQT